MSNPSVPVDAPSVLARAKSQIGTCVYKLGKGGRDPSSKYCGVKNERGIRECDCSGFTSYALGHDRYQSNGPGPEDDVWHNTNYIFSQAMKGTQSLKTQYKKLDKPMVGALIVFPGATVNRERVYKRIGHIGIIVGLGTYATQGIKGLEVIHCSSRYRGVSITNGAPFHNRQYFMGKQDPNWASIFCWPTWRLPLPEVSP